MRHGLYYGDGDVPILALLPPPGQRLCLTLLLFLCPGGRAWLPPLGACAASLERQQPSFSSENNVMSGGLLHAGLAQDAGVVAFFFLVKFSFGL